MKGILLYFFLLLLFISCSERAISETNPDESQFNISDKPQVVNPVFGERWIPGTTATIRWEFPSRTKRIQILLYRKTEIKNIITNTTDNTGSFKWKIPADQLNSVHYRIEIIDIDATSFRTTSEYFNIISQ